MSDRAYILMRTIEPQLEIAENNGMHEVWMTTGFVREIVDVLKEQEEKSVEICGQMFTIKYGHCPKCGEGLNSEVYPKWCGFCGQAVKWE